MGHTAPATIAAIGTLLQSTGEVLSTVVSAHADTAGITATGKGFAVYNNANTILNMQKAPGAASAASFYKIAPNGGYYDDPDHYAGPVRFFWDLDGGGGAPVGNAIVRRAT